MHKLMSLWLGSRSRGAISCTRSLAKAQASLEIFAMAMYMTT